MIDFYLMHNCNLRYKPPTKVQTDCAKAKRLRQGGYNYCHRTRATLNAIGQGLGLELGWA